MNTVILLQNGLSSGWPQGWAIIGWIAAAVVALIYLYSGTLQNLSTGRKDLIEVGEKKLTNITKEKEELEYKVKQLQERIKELEQEKLDLEEERILLMREHHQLLDVSVQDLKTLKSSASTINKLEEEIDNYRNTLGLPPKTS